MKHVFSAYLSLAHAKENKHSKNRCGIQLKKNKTSRRSFKISFLKDCHRPHNQLTLPVSEGFPLLPPSSSFHGRHKLDISNFSRVTHSVVLHYVAGFQTPVAKKHSRQYLHAGMQASSENNIISLRLVVFNKCPQQRWASNGTEISRKLGIPHEVVLLFGNSANSRFATQR